MCGQHYVYVQSIVYSLSAVVRPTLIACPGSLRGVDGRRSSARPRRTGASRHRLSASHHPRQYVFVAGSPAPSLQVAGEASWSHGRCCRRRGLLRRCSVRPRPPALRPRTAARIRQGDNRLLSELSVLCGNARKQWLTCSMLTVTAAAQRSSI